MGGFGDPWPKEEEKLLKTLVATGASPETITKELGKTWNCVRKKIKRMGLPVPKIKKVGDKDQGQALGDEIHTEYGQSDGVITTRSLNIKTLEDALKVSKVDLEKWEVVRYSINSWEVTLKVGEAGERHAETYTNYQVKVWLKTRVIEPLEIAIRELIKEIPKFVPSSKVVRTVPSTPFALELAPYDAHFGKLAWDKEVGQGDYDIRVASEWHLEAIEGNLNFAAPYNLSKIIYILGQDLMHVENYLGQTPIGGHKLDIDSRLPKIYQAAKAATLKALYMCREIAPVEVLWIPGNHDIHASFFVSEIIKEHFKNDKFVEVDNTPPWRKARLWGNLLVGYTHDASRRQTVVVNMLPQFWPDLWGKSRYREWHTGHKHRKEEWKFSPTMTRGGVIIRQIPTMSPIDMWHYTEGYVDAVPASESFIWSKENGVIAHFTSYAGGPK